MFKREEINFKLEARLPFSILKTFVCEHREQYTKIIERYRRDSLQRIFISNDSDSVLLWSKSYLSHNSLLVWFQKNSRLYVTILFELFTALENTHIIPVTFNDEWNRLFSNHRNLRKMSMWMCHNLKE